ncbi:MAG: hypothetical protein ACREDT_15460 [Methylocella sp.]
MKNQVIKFGALSAGAVEEIETAGVIAKLHQARFAFEQTSRALQAAYEHQAAEMRAAYLAEVTSIHNGDA